MESDDLAGRLRYPQLFAPIELAGRRLKNRIVHASINTRMGRNQEVTPALLNYYRTRAAGGAAMIVTEPVSALPWQTVDYRVNVFTDSGFAGLCKLAEAVESHDCRLLAQLQDRGRGRHERGRNPHALGPSALPDDLSWTVPHVMSSDDVERLIDHFVEAATRIRRAGFSGVELSAGHGHLFHQFLSRWSNRRTDRFGGSLENRTRLLRRLAAGIRAACGDDFIIGLKLPGDDGVAGSIDPSEAGRITRSLADPDKVDYFCFVQGSHAHSLHMHIPDMLGPRAPYVSMTARLRAFANGIPVVAIGLITDPAEADALLANKVGELIGFGRPLIADPGLPLKAARGREADIRYCVSCNTCWATTVEDQRPVACDNNPRVAKTDELDWWPQPAAKRKRIVVVGAGVAGMEAAWIAAARGHAVTVFGAGPEVGGKARLRALLPGGEHLSSVYDYQMLAAKRAGVRFELGVVANREQVLALRPDAVVVAAGATMSWPRQLSAKLGIDGAVCDLRSLMWQLSDFRGRDDGTAVIYDHDHTSGTYAAAERLRDIFGRVVIVTPRDRIADEEPLVTRQVIYKRLAQRGIEIIPLAEPSPASRWEDGAMMVSNVLSGVTREIEELALFTYSTPRIPDDALAEALVDGDVDVHVVGDAYAPRTLLAATQDGHAVGNRL